MEKIEGKSYFIYTDKDIQYAIMGLILLPLYIKLMLQLSLIIAFPTSITTTLYYGFIWLLIIKYVLTNFRSATFNFVQLGVLVFAFSLFCSVCGDTGSIYIFNFNLQDMIFFQPKTLFFTSMYMFFGISVQDYSSFTRRLHFISKIGVFFGALIYILSLMSGDLLHYDDMNYAYSLSFVVCILIACYTSKDMIFVISGIICLILAGTRGPLVCVIVAILLKSFLGEKNINTIMKRAAICVLALIFMYSEALIWVLQALINLLSRFGVTQLRILDYMNNNMFFDSSGRDGFYDIIIDAIIEKPILGHGIGGDRVILSQNRYCHNIVLEILVSLGIVLGMIIISWIVYRVFKMLNSDQADLKVIAIAYVSGEIVKLFFSITILQSTQIFVFLGISLVATGRIAWRRSVRQIE